MGAPKTTPASRRGATIWLTGLPSAGKSTIAGHISSALRDAGHQVETLDGDEMRALLTAGLGFSRADRDTNVRRIGFVAELLARNGIKVLVPVIAPFEDSRAAVRSRHDGSATPFLEIHVATPVRVCAQRDVKGLYAKQRKGEISGLTGVDDVYEEPPKPDARIETTDFDPRECAEQVLHLLSARGLA